MPKLQGKTAVKSTLNFTTTKGNKKTWLDYLLVAALLALLMHSISLLNRGHVLFEQQEDAFQVAHKQQFLIQREKVAADFSAGRGTSEEASSSAAAVGPPVTTENVNSAKQQQVAKFVTPQQHPEISTSKLVDTFNILQDLKILVAIASFDFAQVPHFEETLDGYHELCVAGAKVVDVVIHTTVIYPVAWLDMWSTRFPCPRFNLTFVIKNKQVRLHLVDLHRQLFYDELNNYDLFVYTEDDMRVTPTTVATYYSQTQMLERHISPADSLKYNVGIVRYEYNFPSVIINDKTRHATENVTRVYWEHGSYSLAHNQSIIPNVVQPVPGLPSLNGNLFVHMTNHHQGMFIATRAHLEYWDSLPHCNFSVAQNRPGLPRKPSQPLLGTQRVWMSSYQLYEPKYCNIQQVIPINLFGALTVHHLPNKNYRRKKGGVSKLDHDKPTPPPLDVDANGGVGLLTALELHLTMLRAWPAKPQKPYHNRIRIKDEVTRDRSTILEKRLRAFRDYADRGGVLSEDDMEHIDLIEWEERQEKLQRDAERRERQEQRGK